MPRLLRSWMVLRLRVAFSLDPDLGPCLLQGGSDSGALGGAVHLYAEPRLSMDRVTGCWQLELGGRTGFCSRGPISLPPLLR